MKRIRIIRVSRHIAIMTALLTVQAGAFDTATARLHINLREQPDLSSRITAILDAGVEVDILGTHGEFLEVRRAGGGASGYLKAKYLQMHSTSAEIQPPVNAAAGRVQVVLPPQPQSVPAPPAASVPCQCTASGESVAASIPPPQSPAAPVRSRWYGRITAGAGLSTESAHGLQQSLQASGGTVVVSRLDTSSAAFAADVGYTLTPHFAAEAGLLDLGSFKGRIQAAGANSQVSQSILDKHYPIGGVGIDVALAAHQDIGRWDLGLSAGGFCSFDTDIAINGGIAPSQASGRACGALLGGNIDRQIDTNWSLGLVTKAIWLNAPEVVVGFALKYQP
jgi:hypothetical protein